jgi:hypothetical protein
MMFALALGLTLWYGIDAVQQMQHRDALRRDGSETSGEVTRLWTSGHGLYRNVRYTFTVNGNAFTGEAQAPKNYWASLQNGGSLSVRYVSANPAINHPGAWEWSALQKVDLIAGAVFSAACGIFLTSGGNPSPPSA